MRVLFVAPRLPIPLDTGGKIRTWNLLRGISQGAEVTLLSFGGEEEQRRHELPASVRSVRLVPPPWNGKLMDVARLGLGLPLGLPIVVMRYSSPAMALAVSQLSRRADVVHFDHVHLAQYWRFVPRGAPTAFDAHNAEYLIAERLAERQTNPAMKLLVEREARRMLRFEGDRVRSVDLTSCCSEDDARLLRAAAGGGHVEVVPNGVDLEGFGADGDAVDRGHIVLTGSMDWEPNADAAEWLCREILPEVRRKLPGMRAYIVGRKPLPRVQALSSLEGVFVTGTVPDVRPYLRKARCLVVPMRVGGGTRLKILEAFAARIPVVSTRVGYEGIEATPERELLVAETPGEFAEQIARLDRDPALATGLAEAGRDLAERRYGWEAIGRRLLGLLEGTRSRSAVRSASPGGG
jgi:sugar transferase (PEP-CTERM/EpsH1 system associated)